MVRNAHSPALRLVGALGFAAASCSLLNPFDEVTPPGSGGAGGRGSCDTAADCADEGECRRGTCDEGACGLLDEVAGTRCDEGGGEICDGEGSCVPREHCDVDAQCGSAHCVDGVCCDTACEAPCRSCDATVTGKPDGTCSPVAEGTDPDADCAYGARCDSNATCAHLLHRWSATYGDIAEQRVTAVALDADGGSYLAGDYQGTLDLGGAPLAASEEQDAFVAAFTRDGAHRFSLRIGSSGAQYVNDLVPDGGGGVVVAGHFEGALSVGKETRSSAGALDGYILRVAPDGSLAWLWTFGGDGEDRVMGVAALGGGFVATGSFRNRVDLGGGPIDSASAATEDLYVVALDEGGEHVWSKRFGTTAAERPGAIAALDKQLVVVGSFGGTANFGDGALTSAGTFGDGFLLWLDEQGGFVRSAQVGGDGAETVADVALDPQGAALVTGRFSHDVAIGGLGYAAEADQPFLDSFVAKLDSSGTVLWGRHLRGAVSTSVAVSDEGSVVVAGHYTSFVDLGAGAVATEGSADAFVVRLDPGGGYLRARIAGAALDQRALAVAAIPGCCVLAGGELSGSASLGGDALSSNGEALDAWAALLLP